MLTIMISSEERSHFLEGCLSKINEYRFRHGSHELKLNPEISQIAQNWSEYLAEKEGNIRPNPHSVNKYKGLKLGENIEFGSATGVEAINDFYNEEADYDYNVPIFSGNTGHFTQLVWKSSEEVGFGVARCKSLGYILVVNFYPSGNYKNQFQENVLPPQRGRTENVPEKIADFPTGNQTKCENSKYLESPKSIDLLHPKHGIQNLKFSESDEESRSGRGRRSPSPMLVREIYYEPGYTKTIERYFGSGDDFDCHLDLKNRNAPKNDFEDDKDVLKDTEEKLDSYHQLAKCSNGNAVAFEFIDEVIECHNKWRRRQGQVPPLEHNMEISKIAQEWAEVLAHENNSLKASGSKYNGLELGECLATKSSNKAVDYLGSELVEHWYDEKNCYNFNFPNEIAGIAQFGNFTQMVWKNSREIGVGKAWSNDHKKVFIVCNYFPSGNIIGEFMDNVYP